MTILEVLMYSTLLGDGGDRLMGFIVERLLHTTLEFNTLNHPNYQRQVEFYKKHQTFFEEEKESRFDL